MRNGSRLWKSNNDPASSVTSPIPGKSFVVPLFLSRASAHNAYARGALPSSTRSHASTRSVIEDAVPATARVVPMAVPRDARSEVSDMYTGSLHPPEPIPLARNMDDEPTPSEIQATRSRRSGSSGSSHATSSKRSSKRHGVFSKKAYRDPQVSSKAKISFAFGITLLVALIICKFHTIMVPTPRTNTMQTYPSPPRASPKTQCSTSYRSYFCSP